ncbi:MAG: protein kinase [Proteobacteria bacterium]|nr:protein kinase [Pseudomonadota bacterium]
MESSSDRHKHKRGDRLLGLVIDGRYLVMERLAIGGMARVYRAEQMPLGRMVALKLLEPEQLEQDQEFCQRFFLEASSAARLRHPNTVTVFDYGHEEDGLYYIAMELVQGRTLGDLLREQGHLPPTRALHIARQICRGLREAHGLGIIHRDLKPSNVLLTKHGDEEDFVKVVDFGLVKNIQDPHDLTLTGRFMGSPKYASPEQVRSRTVDGRTDIYSLGVLLYRMLSGRVPFERDSDFATLIAHAREPVPRLTIGQSPAPEVLRLLVLRCLAKRPEDRYQGLDRLLSDLRKARRELSSSNKQRAGARRSQASTRLSRPSSTQSSEALEDTPVRGSRLSGTLGRVETVDAPTRHYDREQGWLLGGARQLDRQDEAAARAPTRRLANITTARARARPTVAGTVLALAASFGVWLWLSDSSEPIASEPQPARPERHAIALRSTDWSVPAQRAEVHVDHAGKRTATSSTETEARTERERTWIRVPPAAASAGSRRPLAPNLATDPGSPRQAQAQPRPERAPPMRRVKTNRRTSAGMRKIIVVAQPRSATLELDGRLVAVGVLKTKLKTGRKKHTLRVRAQGYETRKISFRVRPPRRVKLRKARQLFVPVSRTPAKRHRR